MASRGGIARGIESFAVLDDSDVAFLDAIRAGETANGYARRLNYSVPWAKWKSKQVRAKLGAATIGEAVAMTEVTRSDLSDLERRITESVSATISKLTEGLARPSADDAPTKQSAASDLASELRLRGLTLKDLDAAAEAKFNERVAATVDAKLAEREAAAEAERKAKEAEENGGGDEGGGKSKLGNLWANAR
jgi:hypothetical protein